MRFYCITDTADKANHTTAGLLKQACEARGVEYIAIDPMHFNYTDPIEISEKDALYRIAISTESARIIEKYLLMKKPVTLYRSHDIGLGKYDNVIEATMVHEAHGIPIPKTIYSLTKNRAILDSYAASLGGLPLIIKTVGGSRGVGVIKVDSLGSLYSVADYLLAQGATAIMRAYINTPRSARLIVLGDTVIDSIEYRAQGEDFRSNESASPTVASKSFPPDVQETAVRAVNLLGWEFGGVDILIDPHGNHYVTEVNLPCYFPRCQDVTGTDIAGRLIDHLMRKAKA